MYRWVRFAYPASKMCRQNSLDTRVCNYSGSGFHVCGTEPPSTTQGVDVSSDRLAGSKACPTGSGSAGIGNCFREPL